MSNRKEKGFTVLSSTSMIIYPLIKMPTFKEYQYFILNLYAFVFLINPLDSIITSIANMPALSIGYYFI